MKIKITTEDIALIIVMAAVFAAASLLTAPVSLGVYSMEFRFHSMLPAVFAILFGVWQAFIGITLAENIWVLMIGWFIPIGAWGSLGTAVNGLIPGLLVRNPRDWKQVTLWAIVGQIIGDLIVAYNFAWLGFAPFEVAMITLSINNIPVTAIGTPILVRLLLPRVRAMGLYRGKPLKD
jgi:hypothetical protein